MLRTLARTTTLALPLALLACTDDGNADGTADTGTTGGGGDGVLACQPADGSFDESSCMAKDTDYLPGADDMFPACISDGGTYEIAVEVPGSAARIEAFENIAVLLWGDHEPTQQDFADARTQYELDQGLGSRVDRREDLHYPPIPMAEWDPGIDADKQCANTDIINKYPDRCVGPAKMRPLINQAFIDGIEGTGDPTVNAAIVKGTLLWFIYLSVYKESFSCFQIAAEDCDSSWGYFTGAAQLDGELLGFAKMVAGYDPEAAERIFDGILGVRCVRDLYPESMYPPSAVDPLPPDGAALFGLAWEQLDNGLHRGFALVLRQHVVAQDSCGAASAANWRLIQIMGNAIVRETTERDATVGAELEGLVNLDEPTPDDTARIVEILDQVFPCG